MQILSEMVYEALTFILPYIYARYFAKVKFAPVIPDIIFFYWTNSVFLDLRHVLYHYKECTMGIWKRNKKQLNVF